jgi:hypothetical protein
LENESEERTVKSEKSEEVKERSDCGLLIADWEEGIAGLRLQITERGKAVNTVMSEEVRE